MTSQQKFKNQLPNVQLVELFELPEELEPEDVPPDSESELLLPLELVSSLLLLLLEHLDAAETCFPVNDGGRGVWAAMSAKTSLF